MKYTDKQYYIEKKLKEKLDMCIARSTGKRKFDNLWIIDGDEGYGKSTFAMQCAYYAAQEMGRKFTVDNVFFDIKEMFAYAQNTKEQIIVWDEAALGGLTTDWKNRFQSELIKLLMVSRKLKHFWFFNIPKFFKLNEYILVDRSIALVHVYAREEIHLGRFCYFKKKSKEKLFYDRLRTRQRLYKQNYDFHGTFPNVFSELIDEVEYEKKKDKAILSIGKGSQERDIQKLKFQEFKWKAARLPLKRTEIAQHFGVDPHTVTNWKNQQFALENQGK